MPASTPAPDRVILTNKTKQMQVFQLIRQTANHELPIRSEQVTRFKTVEGAGGGKPFFLKFRHPPVIRIPAGTSTKQLPVHVLRDPSIKRALNARPPQLAAKVIEGKPSSSEKTTATPKTSKKRKK